MIRWRMVAARLRAKPAKERTVVFSAEAEPLALRAAN